MADSVLRLSPFRIRLKDPIRTAHGAESTREGVSVVLEDGAGASGLGEATPLPSFGTESLAECLEALTKTTSVINRQRIPESLTEIPGCLSNLGLTQRTPAARHAVECALLDLLANRMGISLATLLSSSSRRHVTVNALLTSRTPEELVREGQSSLAQGFQTLKVKVGAGELGADLERVAILRSAVGPAARIRIDANGAWSEETARSALNSLAPIELCEQPVPADDVEALRRLRGTVPCPIAADEALADPARHEALLSGASRSCDVFVLKPMVLGGILPALDLARRAAAVGIGSYVTSSLDGVIARAAASHLAAALPESTYASGLAVGALFADEPPGHPYVPARGRITLPSASGLGLAGWHASSGRGP